MNPSCFADAVEAIALAHVEKDIAFRVPNTGWCPAERIELTRRVHRHWLRLTGTPLPYAEAVFIVERGSYE